MSSPSSTQTVAAVAGSQDAALIETVNRLLAPLARLCLANGITFSTAEEMFKGAFVQEANALQPVAQAHGVVSRISTATGIRRREVTRLLKADSSVRQTKPPLATQLFARWTTDPALRDDNGEPCALKRQGAAPSFETLAQSITRDIHPRSLLEELIRLGLVEHAEAGDSVTLVRSDFVPKEDSRQMLGFLGSNVGDHLEAAVGNVLKDGRQHFEQAVFADELSAESIKVIRPLVTAQWQALRDSLVPALTSLIEADALAGRPQNQRVRIGLYSFAETVLGSEDSTRECSAKASQNPSQGVS